ncbi:hypothetical protein MYP_1647 [Sporocytophaga myxococcoides]|uniref:Uncharacterized protein n=1 Tax=Sporocytophaga myxococcoides TaxID=153721 RepID=A0A098LDB9_9BACT|nr:hypothetical protein [Sporocytophaga myxococcoides]GAL84419.1 hypothetical protein MYP_1647 [Sporocytophaga myxococcoides]
MIKIFTQNDVIRLVYNEVNDEERDEILHALIKDNDLALFYAELLELESSMLSLKVEPSQKSIDDIINFSKTYVHR